MASSASCSAALGLGGLLYALSVRQLMARLGEQGLALGGGAVLALAFAIVATGPLALMAPAITALGLGLYMLHATLQTNATQMAPEARGLAVSTFANALFLGQAGGVWLAGSAVDRIGFAPVFAAMGIGLLALGAASRAGSVVGSGSQARRSGPTSVVGSGSQARSERMRAWHEERFLQIGPAKSHAHLLGLVRCDSYMELIPLSKAIFRCRSPDPNFRCPART